MASTALVREFERVRRALCRAGVPVHVPWSLSVADGSSMVITPLETDGRPLAHDDLITTSLHYADGRAVRASKDADLHRVAYARGRHRAVLICRPPYAMTLGTIQPALIWGPAMASQTTPRAGGKRTIASIECKELAKHPRADAGAELIMLKGNALLAASVDPASCLDAVVSFEEQCARHLTAPSRPR